MLKDHIPLDAYSQPLATIHLVLKRLLKQKEVHLLGHNEYQWGALIRKKMSNEEHKQGKHVCAEPGVCNVCSPKPTH
jgi:hypothetical protein